MTAVKRTARRPGLGAAAPSVACLTLLMLAAGAGPAVAKDRGFIYGKVETSSGSTFEGRIRWGNEEAFWGDFFNSVKRERTMPEDRPERPRRRERIRIFGIPIGVRWEDSAETRLFKARFGDIREIRVRGGDRATVLMKSGTEYDIAGGSNDIGGKIQIWDPGVGRVEVEWKKIDRIVFGPTPRSLDVADHRLHGTVQTSAGEFSGYIQWDQDECLSSDKLDGETEDADLSLEFGRIGSIERRSRSSSRVTLKDGREFVLEGSNDVNSSNRGIFVEDARFGRVLVTWDAFERVDFSEPGDSGPAYDEFKPGRPLRGTVTDTEGASFSGQIVFDLDEAETWEIFDGNRRDVEYSIPLSLVASIVPRSRDSSLVTLHDGNELELEDTADTGGSTNAGVLVLKNGDDEVYVEWDDVRRVEFER